MLLPATITFNQKVSGFYCWSGAAPGKVRSDSGIRKIKIRFRAESLDTNRQPWAGHIRPVSAAGRLKLQN